MKKPTIILLIILSIVAIVLGRMISLHDGPTSIAACTQEALMCPDGTSVGRSGPQCAFATCATTTKTFEGKLTQQDQTFMLVISAPDTSTQEVSYAMPLEIKVSNVIGQLIGQHVRVTGSFVSGNTFAVDTLEEVPGISANTTVVGVGETKYVNGVRITLNKIVQDSRCPVDVQCIQAGNVTAQVTLKSDTDTETLTMISGKDPHAFDSFKVSITNVAPSRIAASAPATEAYKLTFKVESLATTPKPTFSGTISAFDTACFADGICSVTVGGKVVIIQAGYRINVPPVGALEGVESIGDLDKKIGHMADVYAAKTATGEYTLYGNTAYYVKVR
jgi:hypothetical protein